MKRRIYTTILCAAAVCLLASCERTFLEPWPSEGARTEDDIWSNYKYAKGMVDNMYAYNIMCPYVNDISGNGALASACDEAEHSVASGAVQNFTNGVWNPTSTPTILYGGPWVDREYRSPYVNSYQIIRRANQFLENVDNSVLIDDPDDPTRANDRTYFKGQAYFWRAIAQFWLLRCYGPYVISLSSENIDDDLFRGRNTMDECVAQILADCEKAISMLPTLWVDNQWHRANATAARALKARMLLYYASPLYQGDFESFGLPKNTVGDVDRWVAAADAAREAINTNEYYDLTKPTSYQRPWSGTGSLNFTVGLGAAAVNKEIIWATTRTSTASLQNEYYQMPAGVDGCYGYTNPTQEMVDAFEVVTGTGADRKAVDFDWNNPEHAAAPYENRDMRFYNAILYNGYLWGESSSKAYYIYTYEGGKHRQRTMNNCTKTGYYAHKYLSEAVYSCAKSSEYSTIGRTRFEFRFAELVLNYAEAMNEAYGPEVQDPKGALRLEIDGEPINTAKAAIDIVRDRANMPPLASGLSQDEMREKIKHERRIELCFEGHRFYDLRRWKEGDKLGDPIHGIVIEATGYDAKGVPTGYTYTVEKVEDRVWRDCMYWWPIPYSEIVKYSGKGELEQNPGW